MPCCSTNGRRLLIAVSTPLSVMQLSLSDEPLKWLEMCWILRVHQLWMPLDTKAVVTFDSLDDTVGAPRGRHERTRVGNRLMMLRVHFDMVGEKGAR